MCNIAGYIGKKNAAPILLEMLKAQETFDGGLSTGIATIDNGILYHAKVLGDVDELIKKTDAANFPGTIGIIHSRPDDNYVEFAHPAVSENGATAVVANGNICRDETLFNIRQSAMKMMEESAITFESAVFLEKSSYPVLSDGRFVPYNEAVAKYIEYLRQRDVSNYAEAMSEAASKFFSDVVNVMISANSPDSIYVSRISRPMNIMVADGESYISTSQLAFPKIENVKYIKTLPHMKTSIVTKDGCTQSPCPITGGNVTEFSDEETAQILKDTRETLLKAPTSMDSMGGGIFVPNTQPDKFRPNVKAIYDALWEIHKEGVLKTEIRETTLPWLPETTKVKRTFFYI